MATEGRILTPTDVAGGNPVRTVLVSTTANDEAAATSKDQQVFALGDATTPGNLAAVSPAGAVSVAGRVGPQPAPTATITSQAPTTASAVVLAANANRLGFLVSNEGPVTCYLALAATASLTAYTVQVPPGGYYESAGTNVAYTGALAGITTAGAAQLRVTELT